MSSTDIVIVGIDETAFQEIGPYNTWDRNVTVPGTVTEDRTTIVGMFASLTDEHKADGQYQFNSSGGYFYKTN